MVMPGVFLMKVLSGITFKKVLLCCQVLHLTGRVNGAARCVFDEGAVRCYV